MLAQTKTIPLFLLKISALLIILMSLNVTSASCLNVIQLNYTAHPPMGGIDNTSTKLQSTSDTTGQQLSYHCLIGEKYGYFFEGGAFRSDTDYVIAKPIEDRASYTSKHLGITAGGGGWYKIEPNGVIVYAGAYMGIAEMDFWKQKNGKVAKIENIIVSGFHIGMMGDFYKFQSGHTIGLNAGIGYLDYKVPPFDYGEKHFTEKDFEGDVMFILGATLSF